MTASTLYTYFATQHVVTILMCVLAIVVMCVILCSNAGRKHPVNLALLLVFTCAESYMVTAFTCNPYRFPPHTVMLAGLVTALTTITLTGYALVSKTPITVWVGILLLVVLAMIPVLIVGLCMHMKVLHTICCVFGVLLYGIYLIIDTRIITGKEKHNGISISHDDYVVGAMILYIDIIGMFLYILSLLGDRWTTNYVNQVRNKTSWT